MSKKLFVGGDLSGIQKFIYNISSKKAAVSLRGRSSSVAEYMENVYQKLKGSIGQIQEIYHSGGKFYFIADDTEENRRIINDISKEENKYLWQEHYGILSINIAFVSFDEENPNGDKKTIGKLFSSITQEFNKLKQKKFKDLLLEDYNSFFEVQKIDADLRVCDVTGIESKHLVGIDGELHVLPSVKEQIEKGEELKKVEEFKNFSDYAKGSYFGVLRMDVDGLGKRFADGFDSWSEYSEFSNRLMVFFESKVIESRVKKILDKEYVGLMYAGGDDIFAVGRWDKVIDFAEKVHSEVDKEFAKEGIHISGGIVIGDDKFPIAKYAELSAEAEEKAKKYEKDGELKKNAFTMFNETISWENDFAYVKEYKNKFCELITQEGMSKSILHQLMMYYEKVKENKENKDKNKAKDYSYIWHTAYYLTRYMERYDKNSKIKEFCRELRDKELFKGKNDENFRLIAISCRWAELLLKDKEKQNKK
ncbi:MAG: hypothetical protein IJ681_06825 [Bacteroidales bacterium]|nr:hypothetical protein [Bacteroidales bacterium]